MKISGDPVLDWKALVSSRELGPFLMIRAVDGRRYIWGRRWMMRIWPPAARRFAPRR